MTAFLRTKGIRRGATACPPLTQGAIGNIAIMELKDYIGACEASFSRGSPFAGDRLLHFSSSR
jgi:hypothetical protein